MTKEDVEFLKKLQHEMLTQDNACQAASRFWAVKDVERIYNVTDNKALTSVEKKINARGVE